MTQRGMSCQCVARRDEQQARETRSCGGQTHASMRSLRRSPASIAGPRRRAAAPRASAAALRTAHSGEPSAPARPEPRWPLRANGAASGAVWGPGEPVREGDSVSGASPRMASRCSGLRELTPHCCAEWRVQRAETSVLSSRILADRASKRSNVSQARPARLASAAASPPPPSPSRGGHRCRLCGRASSSAATAAMRAALGAKCSSLSASFTKRTPRSAAPPADSSPARPRTGKICSRARAPASWLG